MLDVTEANEVNIDFGCRACNCGTCLTAPKSGAVEYRNSPGTVVEAGSCLACVAVPRGNIELEA